jgi:putative oxidoreductase
MKIASLISRNLLGLMFVVFGLNGFLHFVNLPVPTGIAGQFLGALFVSHFLIVVSTLQLVSGILLIANRFAVLALTLLGPILVNIVLYHVLMDPKGLPMALFPTILWLIVAFDLRRYFAVLFIQKADVEENVGVPLFV